MSTFTVPDYYGEKFDPEVGIIGLGNENEGTKVYQAYYKWVPFILFLQVN